MKNENRFYVYEWYIVDTNEIFYVGKGARRRAGSVYGRSDNFKTIYHNYKCRYRIVEKNLTEEQAYNKEVELIEHYRKQENSKLVNIYGGGIGMDKDFFCKPVIQLDVEGNFIKEFKSITEARLKTNIDDSCIAKCCKNVPKYNTAGGFMWVYKEEYIPNNKKYKNNRDAKKPVIQFTLDGQYVAEYESIYMACKINNLKNSHIINCCKDLSKSIGGFIWRYKEEYHGEKIKYIDKKKHSKGVIMMDLEGNAIKEFESILQASKYIDPLKDSRQSIKYACENGSIRLKHKWAYKISENTEESH